MTILRIGQWAVTMVVAVAALGLSFLAAVPEMRKHYPVMAQLWPGSIVVDAEAQRFFANLDLQGGNRAGGMQRLLRAIRLEPFSQASAAILLQQRKADGAGAAEIAQLEKLVLTSGWQNSLGQIAAITIAEERGDYPEMVRRSDALLRRAPDDADVIALMVVLESEPAAHSAIVDALSKNAVWRLPWFLGTSKLTPEEVAARSVVIEKYFRAGHTLRPIETGNFLGSLVATGQADRAYQLWQLVYKDSKLKAPVSDPQYGRFASQLSDSQFAPVPFEWQTSFSEDFVLGFTNPGTADATVSIDWTGRGSPLFLRQRIRLTSPNYRLMLHHDGEDSVFSSGKVRVLLSCDKGAFAYATDLNSAQPGRNGSFTTLTTTISSAKSPCAYPELLVQGFGDGGSRPIRMDIGRIELVQ